VQTVELGGPLLASATIALVNVAVFEVARASLGLRAWPVPLVVGIVVYLGVTVAYGAFRIDALEGQTAEAPSLMVGLVQGNVSIEESIADPLQRRRVYIEQTRELEHEAVPLNLVVWPESVFYPWVARTLPGHGPDIRNGLRSPVLLGVTTFVPGTDYEQKFNSALLVNTDQTFGEVYDKNELVMFGEYLPYELVPNANPLAAGTEHAPLHLDSWRLSTPICYEDLLPDFVRRMVRDGDPHVLVNLTNDSWFGDSQGAWIHLRLAQFRAIEHRRYLLRAANTGITAVVDAAGRLVQRTDVETGANLIATVPMLTGSTVYGRFGDWPGWVSLALTLYFVGRRRFEP